MCDGAPLGSFDWSIWASGAADPAGLRQAIRSSQQDRCCGCRGDLRGSWSTKHALRAVSMQLASIPGLGPITASAIAATITDPSVFRSGRELAAWIGLVPRQHSTGGKQRLGRISKQGDRYLRRLLTIDRRDSGDAPAARENRPAFGMFISSFSPLRSSLRCFWRDADGIRRQRSRQWLSITLLPHHDRPRDPCHLVGQC